MQGHHRPSHTGQLARRWWLAAGGWRRGTQRSVVARAETMHDAPALASGGAGSLALGAWETMGDWEMPRCEWRLGLGAWDSGRTGWVGWLVGD